MFTTPTNSEEDRLKGRLDALTAGRFEVGQCLGRGGMAAVYMARDLNLMRTVAIKVLVHGLMQDPGMMERFRREGRTIASLDHPNIVRVHQVEHHEELSFYVLQHVAGGSLAGLLEARERLPLDVILAWFAQIADALDYGHGIGVVHRDIKPGNILLDLRGNAILTDFGIAKVEAQPGQTRVGTMIGTPIYMSPEQWSGKGVTAASDQYALGIVLYEMLTGRPPFTGDTVALMAAHVAMEPPPLDQMRADCPAELVASVNRLLQKDPAERWPKIKDAAHAARAEKPTENDAFYASVTEFTKAVPAGTVAADSPSRIHSLAREHPRTTVGLTAALLSVPLFIWGLPRASEADAAFPTVALSYDQAVVQVGDSVNLSALAITGSDTAEAQGVDWSSSDVGVARVNAAGWVVGVGTGSAQVTVTAPGGQRAVSTIRVEAERLAEGGLPDSGAVATVEEAAGSRDDRGAGPSEAAGPRITGLPPQVSLEVGETRTLDVSVLDGAGTPVSSEQIEWQAEAEGVVSVQPDPAGVIVRGLGPGDTRLQASHQGFTQTVFVEVVYPAIAALSVQPTSVRLEVGQTQSLQAGAPSAGIPHLASGVTWQSSNASVASVDGAGLVIARAPGSASVTATFQGISEATSVEVSAVAEPPSLVGLAATLAVDEATKELVTRTSFVASGTLEGRWCTEITVSRSGREALTRALSVAPAPGGDPTETELRLSMEEPPLEQTQPRETARLGSTVRVWAADCDARREGGLPLGEESGAEVCVVGRPLGGWSTESC